MQTMAFSSLTYLAREGIIRHPILETKRRADAILESVNDLQQQALADQRDLELRATAGKRVNKAELVKLAEDAIEITKGRQAYCQALGEVVTALTVDTIVPAPLRVVDAENILAMLRSVNDHLEQSMKKSQAYVSSSITHLFTTLPHDEALKVAEILAPLLHRSGQQGRAGRLGLRPALHGLPRAGRAVDRWSADDGGVHQARLPVVRAPPSTCSVLSGRMVDEPNGSSEPETLTRASSGVSATGRPRLNCWR